MNDHETLFFILLLKNTYHSFSFDSKIVICAPNTLLMLWQNDCEIVRNLTQSQILSKINDPNALKLYVFFLFLLLLI